LFVAITVGVLFVLQELICRWLFPIPELETFNRINYTPVALFSTEINTVRHAGLSNVIIRWENEPDGFAFDHTLNLYGFRGPDFDVTPPKDRPRVLFIGDSFVEGCGAADHETLPIQVAQIQSEKGQPIEAINLGIAATGLPEYTRLLQDTLGILQPQGVMLVLCYNDLPTMPLAAVMSHPPANLARHSNDVPRAVQVVLRHKRGLVVPRRSPAGPFPFFAAVPSLNNPLSSQPPPDNIDPKVLDAMRRGKANPWNAGAGAAHGPMLRHDFRTGGGAEDYLRHLADLCRQHQTRLIVVYIPHHATTNPDYLSAYARLGEPRLEAFTALQGAAYRMQQAHLRQVTGELQLPFLDMTDIFLAAEQGPKRLFWPMDGHCNSAGYRLLADRCSAIWSATR
jgi:lysophospholipase L1-like esterase